jgi:hypothetical protein
LEKLKSGYKKGKAITNEAITNEAITLIYKLRAITVTSNNGSSMLRAMSNRSDNVSL